MLDNAAAKDRMEELAHSPQLLLGELIFKLETVKDQDKPLFIDNGKRPMGVDSWRGYYAELAIQTESYGHYNTDEVEIHSEYGDYYKKKDIGKKDPTVKEWIKVLKEAVGKTFEGYKGGEFYMSKNTPVWLDEYGHSSFPGVFFVDVREEPDKVYLVTKEQEK